MEINVTGRKMNVGDALTRHVEDRLSLVVDKYFSRSIEASVTFSKENHLIRVDVSLHANQGITLQARGESDDPYNAFELAADRIEKQLRRYKRRLKNHHHVPSREIAMELAQENVLAPTPEEDDADDGGAMNGHGDTGEDQPIIIAESRRQIPRVSVGDAVMLMDLADATTFMFRNTKSDLLEVVYKRPDGNIGWISPETEHTATESP